MSPVSSTELDRALVTQLIHRELGAGVEIGWVDAIGRGNVWRVGLLGADGWPSVIAKREGRERENHLDETAALVVLSPSGVGPRVLATSADPPLVLMEDVPGPSFADHLLGDDAEAARAATLGLAVTLATMHGWMIEHANDFDTLRRGLGPARDRRLHHGQRAADTLRARMAEAGLEPPPELAGDLEVVDRLVDSPGPFHTCVHGDPCPDNVLVETSVRLIDFEWAHTGHALLDGVYLEAPVPTCWCYGVVPEPVVADFEQTYRAALVPSCPAAADDATWLLHFTAASASWWLSGIDSFLAGAFDGDGQWGTASLRQRVIHRTQRFARLTARTGDLTALGSVAARLAERWTVAWDDLDPLEPYPAFR
jgi:hypothetical protein